MAITAGTWQPIDRVGLNQAIADTSTTQNHAIGARVKCKDTGSTNYGEAEFIYLKGVASTAAGDLVSYEADGTTARVAARGVGPVAAAMSACVASNYGWFQIMGLAKVTSGTVAAHKQLYLTSTAGTVDDAVVTGDLIYGATSLAADDTGFVKATLNYPRVGDTDNA